MRRRSAGGRAALSGETAECQASGLVAEVVIKESSLLQGLPDDAVAASKPGELEAVRNDSGIVLVKNRRYVLCVMTAYLKDEKEGSAAIRKISSLSYSYFDRVSRASEYGRVVSPK